MGILNIILLPAANGVLVVKDTVSFVVVLSVATFLVIVAVIGLGKIGVTFELAFISLFTTAPEESVV